MVGLCGLSIDEEHRENFSGELFLGTFYQQHLDQDWSGLAVFNKERKEIKCENYPELFRSAFEKRQKEFEGNEGIGYCGIANEPLERDTKMGRLCACFAGNIQNCLELKEKLIEQGVSFSKRSGDDLDIEVIVNLIAQGENVVDGIKKMTEEIKGTYTLLVLTEEEIVAVRHPSGHWPLILGEKEGETIIASSSAGFPNLGFEIIRDLKPGEIVSIRNGKWRQEELMLTERVQNCAFWWLYFDDPFGKREGIPACEIRKKLGANLAKKDIEKGIIVDIISAEPASGMSYAIGYDQEFRRQANEKKIERAPFFDEVLIKYGYVHRSFVWKTKDKREWEADIKHLPSPQDHRGKSLVLVDDSIVRGTTKQKVVKKIKRQGFEKIHVRIGSPEIYSHCRSGKGLKKGETLASRIPSNSERAKFLEVDSLGHNSLGELYGIFEECGLARDSLCVDCFLTTK